MKIRQFRFFMCRDAVLLCIALVLWAALPVTPLGEWVLGGLTGLCALLLHEWGHLYGAYRLQAVVSPAPRWSPFLFDLDSQENNREQFLSISLWGFFATGIYLVIFWLALPFERFAGQLALGIASFLTFLTVVIEFPLAWRVYRGHGIPAVEIFNRKR